MPSGAGGLQLSINGSGFENRTFVVRLGETLLANGSVRSHMTAGCHYEERWTLTSGVNIFDMGQEYKEWRWAELSGLPVPIELADVGAWVVHYPLDVAEAHFGGAGSSIEDATASASSLLPYGEADTITAFASSDDKLNAVWELGRWTILTTSLDVNTDSNTRQRDNCMIDAFIAAMGQFSVSKAVQIQRRTLEYAMTNGYNFDSQHGKTWSENHMVTVLAARELLLRDQRAGRKLAEEFYPTLLTLTLRSVARTHTMHHRLLSENETRESRGNCVGKGNSNCVLASVICGLSSDAIRLELISCGCALIRAHTQSEVLYGKREPDCERRAWVGIWWPQESVLGSEECVREVRTRLDRLAAKVLGWLL